MDSALFIGAVLLVLFVATAVVSLRLRASLKKRDAEIVREKEDAARRLYELSILKELSERVGYSLDVDEILRIITGSLRQLIDYTAVAYMVIGETKLKFNVNFDKSANHSFFLEMKRRMLASLSALSPKNYEKVKMEESISGAVEMDAGPQNIGSFFNIPLVIGGKLAGVLTIAHNTSGLYKEEDMTILYKITNQASEAVTRLQGVVNREQEKINKIREEYTSMMVHELRSPLNNIRKTIELVISGKLDKNSKDFADYMNLSYQSSSSMLELISDMLDLSKLQAGRFEIHKVPAKISEVIENRIMFYKVATDVKNINLSADLAHDLPESVSFDSEAIKQVLNNFLSNAIKFTDNGGSIVVKAFVKDSFLHVEVSDTGIGISEKSLANLFQTYSQVRLSSAGPGDKGTGLGLAIAKGIVEAHGGKVGAISKEGEGSSFFFTIPLDASQVN